MDANPSPAEGQTEREAYSYAELAKRYGVSTRTLRRWRVAGRLKPAFKVGKYATRLVPVASERPA
jgi:transposase-like protein